MRARRLLLGSVWAFLAAGSLTRPAPAFSAFNLDYVATGRIWVPSLAVKPEGLVSTERVVALVDFGDCDGPPVHTGPELLKARDRDCRFERQVGDALATSGMFRRVDRAPLQSGEVDLVLSARRSRVQFRRQVIPAVKPFVVLTLFAYLWTPLPLEMDVESYDLRVAIQEPTGQLLLEVAVAREFTHYLSSYSAERTAPADLLAELAPTERELGPVLVCRGPHAHVAVHELFQRLGAAVRRLAPHAEERRSQDF